MLNIYVQSPKSLVACTLQTKTFHQRLKSWAVCSVACLGSVLPVASSASAFVYQGVSEGGLREYNAVFSYTSIPQYPLKHFELSWGTKAHFYDRHSIVMPESGTTHHGSFQDSHQGRIHVAVRAVYTENGQTKYSNYSNEFNYVPIGGALITDHTDNKTSFVRPDGGVQITFSKLGNPWQPLTAAVYDPPSGYVPMVNYTADYMVNSSAERRFIETYQRAGSGNGIRFHVLKDIDALVWGSMDYNFPSNWRVTAFASTRHATAQTLPDDYQNGLDSKNVAGCIVLFDASKGFLRRIYMTNDLTRIYWNSNNYETIGLHKGIYHNAKATMDESGSLAYFATDGNARKGQLLVFAKPSDKNPQHSFMLDLDGPVANGGPLEALDPQLRILSLVKRPNYAALFAVNAFTGALTAFPLDPDTLRFRANSNGIQSVRRGPYDGGLTVVKQVYALPDQKNLFVLWEKELTNEVAVWGMTPDGFNIDQRYAFPLGQGELLASAASSDSRSASGLIPDPKSRGVVNFSVPRYDFIFEQSNMHFAKGRLRLQDSIAHESSTGQTQKTDLPSQEADALATRKAIWRSKSLLGRKELG